MYTLILVGLLFGGSANLDIGPFISKDACKAVASHVITDGVGKVECHAIETN